MPVTVKPARANSTARGSPTYPSPTTPTRARRVRIFSAKSCAVAPGKVSSADSVIEPIFSHSARARGGSRSEADWSRRFLLGEFLTHAGKAPFEQAAARTHAEIGEVDALGGVVHATGASRLDARPDGGQGLHPLHQIRPLRYWAVTRNHDIEIVLERLLNGGVPFLDAAAVGDVAERRTGCDEEVAGVQHALGREVDYGVAVGVAAPEVSGHYLFAAEKDLLLVAEGEMGQAGLIPGHHIGAGVFGQDHFGVGRQHGCVAAGVVTVMMRVQHVTDRPVADSLDLGDDARRVLGELIVHHDDAFGGGHDGHIAAGAHDDPQILGDLLDGQRLPRLLLCPGGPEARGPSQNQRYTSDRVITGCHSSILYTQRR